MKIPATQVSPHPQKVTRAPFKAGPPRGGSSNEIPASQVSPQPQARAAFKTPPTHGGSANKSTSCKPRDGPVHLYGDRIVSLPEASAITDLSIDTLRRCNKRGELQIIKLSPRRAGIRLSTLWAFVESRAG